jgi:Cu2+-exporting ATPase
VLVVTCPCAFGIATPLAYELAVSGLRKAALFVRDGSFFDRAAQVRRVVFDKTGTLTTGALELENPELLLGLEAASRAVLYDLAARSNHPKSTAIARALLRVDATLCLRDIHAHEVPGRGVEAELDGVCYRLGAGSWAATNHDVTRHAPVFAADGKVLVELHTAEVSRPDAVREAEALRKAGYELWIASGDESERVQAMARALGIPREHARGDLSPQDKRALIEAIDRKDTLMIGDGINDGPALSHALCSGTPAVDRPFVPARADFYFLTPGLHPIRTALRAGKAVRRVVRTALGFATLYNVFAVGLCYAGLMRPWLAAVLMPASSLLVLAYTALALSPGRRLWRS